MERSSGIATSMNVLFQLLDEVGLDQMHAEQTAPATTSKKHNSHSAADSRLHASLSSTVLTTTPFPPALQSEFETYLVGHNPVIQ